ncbi:hypothetical protein EJ110_NYTH08921 [Nymphaea thermarum]|nr:hypothetical protein EJ110_NYTH08921 [Nymphaea thermarum]
MIDHFFLSYTRQKSDLSSSEPIYKQLKVFGCKCYILNNKNDKLSFKAIRCVFIGYSDTQKRYRYYDVEKDKLPKDNRSHTGEYILPIQPGIIVNCVDEVLQGGNGYERVGGGDRNFVYAGRLDDGLHGLLRKHFRYVVHVLDLVRLLADRAARIVPRSRDSSEREKDAIRAPRFQPGGDRQCLSVGKEMARRTEYWTRLRRRRRSSWVVVAVVVVVESRGGGGGEVVGADKKGKGGGDAPSATAGGGGSHGRR